MRSSISRSALRLRARMRRLPVVRKLDRKNPSTRRKAGILATTALAGALAVGAGHYAFSPSERPSAVDLKRIVRVVEKETRSRPFVVPEHVGRVPITSEIRARNNDFAERENYSKVAFFDPVSEKIRVFDLEKHGIRSLTDLRALVPEEFRPSVDGIVNKYVDARTQDITHTLKLEIGRAYNLQVFPENPVQAKALVRDYVWRRLPFEEWSNKFLSRGAEDLHYYISRAHPRVFLEIERQESENARSSRSRRVVRSAQAAPWGAGAGLLAGLAWLLGSRPRTRKTK